VNPFVQLNLSYGTLFHKPASLIYITSPFFFGNLFLMILFFPYLLVDNHVFFPPFFVPTYFELNPSNVSLDTSTFLWISLQLSSVFPNFLSILPPFLSSLGHQAPIRNFCSTPGYLISSRFLYIILTAFMLKSPYKHF